MCCVVRSEEARIEVGGDGGDHGCDDGGGDGGLRSGIEVEIGDRG